MAGKLSETDKRTFEHFLKSGSKEFKLLYSFARDGANSGTFHTNCNNKGPTLTVIYDTEGSVYGGFTDQVWTGAGAYSIDRRAFLFRLRFKKNEAVSKFPVKRPESAIYCNAAYGPTFGGHDIYSFNGVLTAQNNVFTLNGSFSFGHSYDMGGVTIDQINGNVKTVTDLEVYEVADIVVDRPWREIGEWDLEHLQELKSELESYCPPHGIEVKSSRVLFLGAVGAGKSSFFNTIASVFRGHVTGQAVCGSAEQSITSKFRIYRVRGSSLIQPLKFRLCDTRGIEENQGIDGTELNYLLEGNVPDGYQFNPSTPISPDIPGFISTPTLNEKIHCVCFVVDGSTAAVLPEKMLDKIKALQMKVRQKGVPQLILLTKVDKVCYEAEADVTTTFKSEAIRNLVDKVSDIFGVPRYHVLPVKNYEKEIDVKTDVSILALVALRQILRSSEDYLFNYLDMLEDKKKDSEGLE